MHRHESTHRTVLLLDKLIFWTCPTGALTCLTAVAINIIFMLFAESFAWLAMLYILTNLYANTLIVLLNSRWEMDQDDFDDTTTLTTFRVSGSRPHSQHLLPFWPIVVPSTESYLQPLGGTSSPRIFTVVLRGC
ncbi:hypothetical protein ONZ45_g9533 [Pleurotus djamor]|nr:hypothetical protein ONZ45_g9533 [Pleurotus djamor]